MAHQCHRHDEIIQEQNRMHTLRLHEHAFSLGRIHPSIDRPSPCPRQIEQSRATRFELGGAISPHHLQNTWKSQTAFLYQSGAIPEDPVRSAPRTRSAIRGNLSRRSVDWATAIAAQLLLMDGRSCRPPLLLTLPYQVQTAASPALQLVSHSDRTRLPSPSRIGSRARAAGMA